MFFGRAGLLKIHSQTKFDRGTQHLGHELPQPFVGDGRLLSVVNCRLCGAAQGDPCDDSRDEPPNATTIDLTIWLLRDPLMTTQFPLDGMITVVAQGYKSDSDLLNRT